MASSSTAIGTANSNTDSEGEFESDGEYDQESGTAVKRVINQPKIVDRETYDEFEIGEEISPPSDTRMPVNDTIDRPVPVHLRHRGQNEERGR